MQRRPNTQTVQWFLEMDGSGQLDLDPSYQRRSVWNDSYRRFYIDTVLRNFPSPAIYLETETRLGSSTIYHVIDGKQRLETLISFTKDGFHLGNLFSDEGYNQAYFSDLSSELQDALVDYVLSVENISRSSEGEIKSAFERLNKNTAKLNRQELRKAQFSGEFISKMTSYAEHPIWTDIGIATRARISRMQDVEFVSEIYLLSMHGIVDGSDNLLDDYYAEYDEEIPNQDATDEEYFRILDWVGDLAIPWRSTRWNNLGDFYSIWAAAHSLGANSLPDPGQTAQRLLAFADRLLSPSTSDERAYSDAARQGTNKESSRRTRAEVLARVFISES